MEQKCVVTLTKGEVYTLLIVVFGRPIEPQEKNFVDPVDYHKVYSCDDIHDRQAWRVRESCPSEGNDLGQSGIERELRPHIHILVIFLEKFPTLLFITCAPTIPASLNIEINYLR